MTGSQIEPTNATPERTFQFGLRTLLVLPLMVVIYFTLTHWFGVYLAVAFTIPVGLGFACFNARTRSWAVRLLVSYLVLGAFVALRLPMRGGARETARRCQCTYHLNMIGRALHKYHDTFGSLPPAYIADDQGRPLHSWRVLILPFLEQQPLYDRYRFDEPWNSPHNIKLVEEMPSVFQCPSNQSEKNTCTNYVVVIGPQTAWPGGKAVHFSDITDGTSNTWLVVEVADSGIAWSEPRDLHVQQMAPEINPPAGQGISSNHPGGVCVLCADGSVRFVGDASYAERSLDSEDVHGLLTIDGDDPVDWDW